MLVILQFLQELHRPVTTRCVHFLTDKRELELENMNISANDVNGVHFTPHSTVRNKPQFSARLFVFVCVESTLRCHRITFSMPRFWEVNMNILFLIILQVSC